MDLWYYFLITSLKVYVFKQRIKKFRKTNDYNLITEGRFDTASIKLLNFLICLLSIILTIVVVFYIAFISMLLISLIIQQPNNTTNFVTLIVGVLGALGVVYSAYRKQKDKKKDRFDNSIYMIVQYLVEIKRGNLTYKIFKDDLSYIFMNVPNNILFILRDIQDNIKKLSTLKVDEKKKCEETINKEVLFLLVYIREFYRIVDADIKQCSEHEEVINDLIINSSITKRKAKKQQIDSSTTENKKVSRKENI